MGLPAPLWLAPLPAGRQLQGFAPRARHIIGTQHQLNIQQPQNFRQLANEENIRFIACRRSVCSLKQSLECVGLSERCASCPNACHRKH